MCALTLVSFLCLLREQFLKANAQLTFRCRQLLYELSYIYPIDVVSSGFKSGPAQLRRIIGCQKWGFDHAETIPRAADRSLSAWLFYIW